MADPFYVGVYWGERPETSCSCADRALAVFNRLAGIDEQFTAWYHLGSSRRQALEKRIEVTRPLIQKQFAKGVNRRDDNREPIPELGFSFNAWNGGADGEASSVSFACGMYSKYVTNVAVLKLPKSGEAAYRVVRTAKVIQLLQVLVEAFEPDWGCVAGSDLYGLLPDPSGRCPRVGWLTYVADSFMPVIPGPEFDLIRQGQGSLVVTTEEIFSGKNPEHVRSLVAANDMVAAQCVLSQRYGGESGRSGISLTMGNGVT